MKYEIIIPEPHSSGDTPEKIRDQQQKGITFELFPLPHPFDKLVNNDQLSYLPNLYLRQYKLIDELARIRHDFPEQKILLPRPRTTWDTVLEDVAFASHIFQERRKLKIATAATAAREARNEVQRTQLRAEEEYHFHRIIGGYLGEAVVQQFKQCSQIPRVEMVQQKQMEKQGPKKNQDDIFMNEDEEDYHYMPEEPDLLDELLVGEGVDGGRMQEELPPAIQIEPVSTYISEKYSDRQLIIKQEPLIAVSRKGSLRKINQCVRKRLKFKEEEEEQAGRSLSSATVFLSNLLSSYPDAKAVTEVEALSKSEWIFVADRPRKRKDEDGYEPRWPPEIIQLMERRNDRNSLKRGKLDSGILMLTSSKDDEQYRKVFQKQIMGDKNFPPTLRNVQEAAPERRQKYFNEFHDSDYELFVMKYNKQQLFQKFAQKATMIFPENYSQDDVEDAENISAGKLFIHKPEKLLQRVVFLKEERQVKTFLRSKPKHSIDEKRALLLAFLVEKYLKEFGNNWKNIAQLVCRHLAFSQKHITVEFVQEIYQMVMRLSENRNTIPGLELWDKKLLPSSYGHTPSYTLFEANRTGGRVSPRRNDSSNQSNPSTEDDTPITVDSYAEMVEEEVEDVVSPPYHGLEEEFEQFLKPIADNIPQLVTSSSHQDLAEAIAKILEMYQDETDIIHYGADEHFNIDRDASRHQLLGDILRIEIKIAAPFRKKKSINERNNQLVKILQALRNKNVPSSVNPAQKKAEDGLKQTGTGSAVPKASIAPSQPTQKPQAATDLKKSMKSPEKPDKKLGAPSKKDKKHKDNEDKK